MRTNLKKILLLIPIVAYADNVKLHLWFKNGKDIEIRAGSIFTNYNKEHNYYKHLQHVPADKGYVYDTNYLCFWDYCAMNPASRETKRGDYKEFRDKVQLTGNEANYFEDNGTVIDDWSISLRYDQLDSVSEDQYATENWHFIYKNGEKL